MEPSAGMAGCSNCPHPRATHDLTDPYPCRLNGCYCSGYADLEALAVVEQGQARSVTFTIPEGFGFSVSFYPIQPDGPADE